MRMVCAQKKQKPRREERRSRSKTEFLFEICDWPGGLRLRRAARTVYLAWMSVQALPGCQSVPQGFASLGTEKTCVLCPINSVQGMQHRIRCTAAPPTSESAHKCRVIEGAHTDVCSISPDSTIVQGASPSAFV